ncbi:MAG: hydroxysqualene dehydroxylase HpnE [Burkholderiales bacterium]|nr:hydroxysqualene dehydroxylase HpnE [Burkholderiales bacterium]
MVQAAQLKPTVAIIGGGYAGMAAAITLAQHGVRCVVFEAGKVLGGRARRIEYLGETIDNGQHILAGAYTELLRLMRLVGVPDSSLSRVRLRLSMPPDFLLSAPRTSLLQGSAYLAWTLLTTKGLTFSDKVSAIRFMLALKRAQYKIDEHKSVATLLAEQKQSQNLIDQLWQPLTISALNTPLATASAQVFANVLRDSLASTRQASDLLLPRVDLTALFPEPAAVWLAQHGGDVRTSARIKQVLVSDNCYQLVADAESQYFDGVILAVGPHQLEGIMPGISCPSFSYEPIVTIYFKFDRAIRLRETMFGQKNGMAQWFFDRRALSHGENVNSANDETSGLVAAVISASGPHELLTQDELAKRVLAELSAFVNDLPTPVWFKVVTEKFATFACTPHASRPAAMTCHPGVFLAGDYVSGDYPATLEGAVRNGISAANASITRLLSLKSNE